MEGMKPGPIKCDCCGTETLAELKDGKLVIFAKRHGVRHIVVLHLATLTETRIGVIREVIE